MFAARVLTLRASMQFGPGGACPYPWTDEVRDIFRLEVQDIVKETFNGADILNRQLQRLIDDERLLLDNMYVGILPVDHPYLEVSGDGVYGYPGPKGVLKPLLNRLVGFPWWSIDGLHDLAEWESELDPSNALTKEAASLERTLEVAEIEDALELALSEEISEGLRVKEAEIKGKVKVLEGMIREIAGVPMSLHVDETYDHTEIPPKFPESIRSPELWAEPQESTWGKSTTMQDRVEHQGKDTKIRTAGKKGIKGVVLPGPPPKFRSNRGGGGGGKHLGARGGEKRRFIPKQGSDAVSKLSSETAKKDGVDWEDHLEERDSSLVDVI
ncbi:hypothetical protein I317_00547 [Kwoniella heveanensis CBS 569]|uniref:Uncharacterized protein n=1 Tax=Kwoniella heveanensis BCC8398 TaxID=1296120 RepID=A0A1B9GYI7_9TREE|nr:hypothetical protein I316_02520 [Kwoniella heveanensis BCC8398]OCF45645.1 hypothetical protein I317_00547 [Kwoniella heveanensis CBS 569]